MGVFGLWSFCMSRKKEWCFDVDLLEVAKEKGGIEILVDYYAFQQYLVNSFWDGLAKCTGNKYLLFLGGEYGALDAFVSKLVNDLKELEIQLVVFVDGSKGSSVVGTEQKLDTWKSRHFADITRLHAVLEVVTGKKRLELLTEEIKIRPVLQEKQVFATLKKCGVECVFKCGEADFVLAKHLQTRPKAFAILSNDTDFCLFKDCQFIPIKLFDQDNSLGLGGVQDGEWLPQKPSQLRCGMMASDRVLKVLGLSDLKQLIDVGIILGNDFTTQYVRQLKYDLGVRGKGSAVDVQQCLQWIKQQGCLENSVIVMKQMEQNRNFKEAVRRSRQFYALELPADEATFKGAMSQMLFDGIERGQYESSLMSMHNNFFWYRMLLEDCGRGVPSGEEALYPLRACIYRMVLLPREKVVVEYGRTMWTDFSTAGVDASNNPRIPLLDQIDPQKVFVNLRTLNMILLHQEFDRSRRNTLLFDHKGNVINFFDRYGRRNGFLCLLLRYFLVLNWQNNLCISLEEWLPLVACLFAKVDQPWYCGLRIQPCLRTITIFNWFQNLFRYSCYALGSLLHVQHEFPEPKEIFSGAVFSGFYAYCNCRLPPNMDPELVDRIKHNVNFIISEKRHLIKFLLEDYVVFNTNFRDFFH